MKVVGIDPGLAGGIACVDVETGQVIAVHAMPVSAGTRREIDAPGLASILRSAPDVRLVTIERVGAMPRQGLSSTFKFGCAYGTALGVAGALGLAVELVSPVAWQRVILAGTSKGDKGAAAAYAARRWPGVDLRASSKCRTPHDGVTDALCLAEFGRRLLIGKGTPENPDAQE